MRIGIDVYNLSRFRAFAGISNYLYNILRKLEIIDRENEYFLYNNEDINFSFNNPKWHKRIYSGLLGKSHTIWANTILINQLLKDKIDIFWQPNGALVPIFMPKNIKVITTIYDLVLQYYPETMDWSNRFICSIFFKESYKRADVVICISNSTADGIKKVFPNLSARKNIAVIYAGVDKNIFKPFDKDESRDFVKKKFNIDNGYILFVGTLEPRKNIHTLIDAFASLVREKKHLNYQLVIAGKDEWGDVVILDLLHKYDLGEQEVRFLGYVAIEDLVYLYSGATAFVMPSIYEGFGLPILEAMACGCPVITSNVSSMPEVAGAAAILVDPRNVQDIYEAIYNIMANLNIREELKNNGFENIKRFSWEKSAQEVERVLKIL